MTEGGCTFILNAGQRPDKLHTVGVAAPGQFAKIIDDDGNELPKGEVGEIVGRSSIMMSGYFNRPDATKSAQWTDSEGETYLRHGDIGRLDEDGFLTILDRKKDVIISGGFNIYSSDLEAVLLADPDIKRRGGARSAE